MQKGLSFLQFCNYLNTCSHQFDYMDYGLENSYVHFDKHVYDLYRMYCKWFYFQGLY
jgi:hypothetical protein